MSASRGVGFTVKAGIERLGVDGLRHALCSLNPESADVEFTWEHAAELRRTGLLGAIANPVYRVASLLWSRYEGRTDAQAWADAVSEREAAGARLESIGVMFRDAELREALSLVQAVGAEVNRTLAKEEPWRLPHEEGHRVLTRLLPALDVLGVASWPVVPETASRIRRILGREIEPRGWSLEEGPPVIRDAPVPPLQL